MRSWALSPHRRFSPCAGSIRALPRLLVLAGSAGWAAWALPVGLTTAVAVLYQRGLSELSVDAATLMLASGENPEWVARVLGHASTEMLFRVYSRYVPNLTRNDGRAFTGLVTGQSADRAMPVLPSSLAALSRAQLEHLVRTLHQEAPHAGA